MPINLHACRFNPIINDAQPLFIHRIWILIRDFLAGLLEVVLHHQRLHAPIDLSSILTALLVHCSYEINLVLLLKQLLLAILSLELDLERLHDPILLRHYASLLAWLWVTSIWLDVMPVSHHSINTLRLFLVVATNLSAAWLESAFTHIDEWYLTKIKKCSNYFIIYLGNANLKYEMPI